MEVYAYQAKDAELAGYAVEIRRRAVRRIGELMNSQPKAKGTRGLGKPKIGGVSKTPPKDAPTLADQGVDKNLAKQAREAAAMSEDKFEKEVARAVKVAVAAATDDKAIVRAARADRHQMKKKKREEHERKLGAKIFALPTKKTA